jgi:MSHA biogenesis protein MshJ
VTARISVRDLAARFDRLSLRERLLTTAAVLAVVVASFNAFVLNHLEAQKNQLSEQLNEIVTDIDSSAAALSEDNAGTAGGAMASSRILSQRLARATTRLDSASAGLIPPQRMVQVIHDVLDRQHGVVLISLRTLPPYPLLGDKAASEGPYVHSVDLVLEGRYLDVLEYLRALESSPWHFYWQKIDLDASRHPLSLVQVRLGTVSARRAWIQL